MSKSYEIFPDGEILIFYSDGDYNNEQYDASRIHKGYTVSRHRTLAEAIAHREELGLAYFKLTSFPPPPVEEDKSIIRHKFKVPLVTPNGRVREYDTVFYDGKVCYLKGYDRPFKHTEQGMVIGVHPPTDNHQYLTVDIVFQPTEE